MLFSLFVVVYIKKSLALTVLQISKFYFRFGLKEH